MSSSRTIWKIADCFKGDSLFSFREICAFFVHHQKSDFSSLSLSTSRLSKQFNFNLRSSMSRSVDFPQREHRVADWRLIKVWFTIINELSSCVQLKRWKHAKQSRFDIWWLGMVRKLGHVELGKAFMKTLNLKRIANRARSLTGKVYIFDLSLV